MNASARVRWLLAGGDLCFGCRRNSVDVLTEATHAAPAGRGFCWTCVSRLHIRAFVTVPGRERRGIDESAAHDAMRASDVAVSHASCVARARRQTVVGGVVAFTVTAALQVAYFATLGRVPGLVSWLIVAALLTAAVATAVGVWLNQRPCGCVGDTGPFLAQLGAAPTQTTTTVDAGRDSDH